MPIAVPRAATMAPQTAGTGVTSSPRARSLARHSRPGAAPAAAEAHQPPPECSISTWRLAATARRTGATSMAEECSETMSSLHP